MIEFNDGTLFINTLDDFISISYPTSDSEFSTHIKRFTKNVPEQNAFTKMLYDCNIPFIIRTYDYDYAIINNEIKITEYQIFQNAREDFFNEYTTHENLKIFELMRKI